jgi:hypothetical protein
MQSAQHTTESEIKIHDLSELDTLDELTARYPDKFTKAQLQWALRFRDENGLDAAVVKLGRRLYLHRPTFMMWLVNRRGAA